MPPVKMRSMRSLRPYQKVGSSQAAESNALYALHPGYTVVVHVNGEDEEMVHPSGPLAPFVDNPYDFAPRIMLGKDDRITLAKPGLVNTSCWFNVGDCRQRFEIFGSVEKRIKDFNDDPDKENWTDDDEKLYNSVFAFFDTKSARKLNGRFLFAGAMTKNCKAVRKFFEETHFSSLNPLDVTGEQMRMFNERFSLVRKDFDTAKVWFRDLLREKSKFEECEQDSKVAKMILGYERPERGELFRCFIEEAIRASNKGECSDSVCDRFARNLSMTVEFMNALSAENEEEDS